MTSAQTFTVLHTLTGPEGISLWAGLSLSGNALYGAAAAGGYGGGGTIFQINTDGSSFTNVHHLHLASEGAGTRARLLQVGNVLYGAAQDWGSSGKGAVFAICTDGSNFTNLHSFSGGNDGGNPRTGLILSGSDLYGATSSGGSFGAGALFTIRTDGTGLTNIHSFEGGSTGSSPDMYAGLVSSGGTLYGTTSGGGVWSNGTVFRINIDGTAFTNLYSFGAFEQQSGGYYTNRDGAAPYGGSALAGNTLYGVATAGGRSEGGTVFRINTDGTVFANLYDFSKGNYSAILTTVTNNDGRNPVGALALSGSTLYGTAVNGGNFGVGTVFALNIDGSGFTNLHSFAAGGRNTSYVFTNSEGGLPRAGLILSGNTLYGTTETGGYSGRGTVFSLSLPGPPRLWIVASTPDVVLSWPTNTTGFALQSAPASTGTFTNIPGATSPYTNPIAGAQQFFRLISN